MKRPLVWCAAVFTLGTAVVLDFSLIYIIVIAGCILFTAYSYKRLSYLILLPVFLLGMLPIHIYNMKYIEPIQKYNETSTQLAFEVNGTARSRSSGGYYKYTIAAKSADGEPFNFSGELYTYGRYSENDIVSAKCKIYAISDDDNYKYQKINKGLQFSAFSTAGKIIGQKETGLLGKIKAFRKNVINDIKSKSDPRVFGFLSAILTGDKEYLSDYRAETFRKTGLSHLMAVSGLHVSMLLGFLLMILKTFRTKRFLINIICTVFLAILIPFMNFSPSAIRAVIMNLVILWSGTVKKDADSLSSLSFAAIILLIFRPYSLKDLSFVLSFTATLGIILLEPRIEIFLEKITKRKSPSLSVILSVFIFMLPLNLYYFGNLNPISIPANLIFVPALPIIMIILIAALVLGKYIPFIIYVLNYITKVYLGAVETISKLPANGFEVSITDPLVLVLLITVALSFVFKSEMRVMFLSVSGLIAFDLLIKSIEIF